MHEGPRWASASYNQNTDHNAVRKEACVKTASFRCVMVQ
uniref:Uncharacterized protein n=1 Tax=Anopheles dirus TaxID=7168 RepID=A0A182NX73_9DIPT